jgi:hypothetical protein
VLRPYRLLVLEVERERIGRLHAYGEPLVLEAFSRSQRD